MSAPSPWTGPRGNWFSEMSSAEKHRRFGQPNAAENYISDLRVEDLNDANYAALYYRHLQTGSKAPAVSKHRVTPDEAKIIRDILTYAYEQERKNGAWHGPDAERLNSRRGAARTKGRTSSRAARRAGVR